VDPELENYSLNRGYVQNAAVAYVAATEVGATPYGPYGHIRQKPSET